MSAYHPIFKQHYQATLLFSEILFIQVDETLTLFGKAISC